MSGCGCGMFRHTKFILRTFVPAALPAGTKGLMIVGPLPNVLRLSLMTQDAGGTFNQPIPLVQSETPRDISPLFATADAGAIYVSTEEQIFDIHNRLTLNPGGALPQVLMVIAQVADP